MADLITMSDKQYLAKILYTTEKLDQKIIAKKVGVSEKTIGKWVNDFNWKSLRNRLLVGKEEVLNNLYEQMERLNDKIRTRKDGDHIGHADTKEADILIKYTASIRNLETQLAIADLVESGKRFIKHLQSVGTPDQVKTFADLWHSFIMESIRK